MADNSQNNKQGGINEKHYETSTTFEPIDRLSSTTMKRRPQMELNKTDLLRLLSYLEGELQGRDVTIAALKAERTRNLVHQAKYGRFGLDDPLLALQRDHTAQVDATPANEERAAIDSMYQSQMKQLDNLIETQKKAQHKMRDQLLSIENRYHKVCSELDEEKRKHAQDTAQGDDVTYLLEKERERLKNELEFERNKCHRLEKDARKLNSALSEANIKCDKYKRVALLLLKDRKQLLEVLARLADESFYGGSETPSMNSSWHEERSQLRARIEREESRSKNLENEIEQLRNVIVSSQSNSSLAANAIMNSKLPVKVSSKATPPQTPPSERRRVSPQENCNTIINRSQISPKSSSTLLSDTLQNRQPSTVQNQHQQYSPNLSRPQQSYSVPPPMQILNTQHVTASPTSLSKGKKPVPPVRTSTLSTIQPASTTPNKPVLNVGSRATPVQTFQTADMKKDGKNGPQTLVLLKQANEFKEKVPNSDLSFLDENIQDFQKTFGSLQGFWSDVEGPSLKTAVISGSLGDLYMTLNNSIVDVNEIFDDCNMTALHLAAIYGHAECLKVLFDHNGDSTILSKYNEDTILHLAAANNRMDACQIILEKNCKLLGYCNIKKKTSLHCSIENQCFNSFQTIIKFASKTLRHMVFDEKFGKKLLCQLLMMEDEDGCSVAEIAVRHSDSKWLQMIIDHVHFTFMETNSTDVTLKSMANDANKLFIENYLRNVRTVLVQVLCGKSLITIDCVVVKFQTSWTELLKLLHDTWINYAKLISNYSNSNSLGLETDQAIKFCMFDLLEFSKRNVSILDNSSQARIFDLLSSKNNTEDDKRNNIILHLEEKSIFELSFTTLTSVKLIDEWLKILENRKHLFFTSLSNCGKKYIARKLSVCLQNNLQKKNFSKSYQIVFISENYQNENDIYLKLISCGALLVKSKMQIENAIKNIPLVLFDAIDSVAIKVFLAISRCLHNRGSDYCLRFKLNGQSSPENYYIPSFCYFIILFDSMTFDDVQFAFKSSMEVVNNRITDCEPLSNLVGRYFRREFTNKYCQLITWLDSIYKNLNINSEKLSLKNVHFGPTIFLQAPLKGTTDDGEENSDNQSLNIIQWLITKWNKEFSILIKSNIDKDMTDTALNVLIQRAIVPFCPLNGNDLETFLNKLEGREKKKSQGFLYERRLSSTPTNRRTSTPKRPSSAGARVRQVGRRNFNSGNTSPFRPVDLTFEREKI